MDVISPELALVDGNLAESARRLLPSPGDCLAPRPRRLEPVTALSLGLDPGSPRGATPERFADGGRARPSLVIVVAALLVAGIVGSPAVDLVRSHPSNGSHVLSGPEATAGAQLKGVGGAASDLSWQPVPGAVAYELVIRDGARTVLMLRLVTSHVSLSSGTPERGDPIAAGAYAWSVAPVLRDGGEARVGPVSESGVLRIPE